MWRLIILLGFTLFRKGGNTLAADTPANNEVLAEKLSADLTTAFSGLVIKDGINRCEILKELLNTNDATFSGAVNAFKLKNGRSLEEAIIDIERLLKFTIGTRLFCKDEPIVYQDEVIKRMQQLGLT